MKTICLMCHGKTLFERESGRFGAGVVDLI